MDLADTATEAAFRSRLRHWLVEHAPPEPLPAEFDEAHPFLVDWHRRLYAGGWLGLSWPAEYGGQGLGPIEEAIFAEELARSGAPSGPLLGYIGRPLLSVGTEDQKRRYLGPMLSSEELWCQGFSEPGAGSDLANVRTRAVDAGDHFVVTGQKIWTSFAQFADWCFLLARTTSEGPRHAGLSALIVDMHSAGITVRPIRQITGNREYSEVFFDEVAVPRAQLLGRPGDGWAVAMTLLAYERGPVDIGFQSKHRRVLAQLREEVIARGRDRDPLTRLEIARAAVAVEVLRLHVLRGLSQRITGRDPGPEGSVDKVLMSNVEQQLMQTATSTLGPRSLLDDDGWFDSYLYSRSASIYGGTREIQKNILATRVLGLPRSS